MKFIKKFILKSVALALCVFCLCSCKSEDGIIAPITDISSEEGISYSAKSGGTLNIPITPYSSLHPLFAKEAQTRNLFSCIFETLLTFDDNFEPIPLLAQTWSYSDSVWTFEIRPGVHWHDGRGEVSALDAAYTINTVLASPESIYYSSLAPFAVSASAEGSSLKINVKNPSYALLYSLASVPLISEEYYSSLAPDTLATPIGSGCFCVDEISENEIILLQNQKWWKKLPYLEKVCAKKYSDTDETVDAFLSGEIDCFPTSRQTTEIYEILDGVSSQEYISHNYVFLGINNTRKYLSMPEFRSALAYAIDRTEIINNIYLSKASGAEQPLFNDYSVSSAGIKRHDTNLTKSKEILSSLGFTEKNGYLEYSGERVSFEISVINNSEDPVREEAAQNIKKQFEKIGISVSVKTYSEEVLSQKLSSGNYDLVLTGYYLSDAPNVNFLFSSGGNVNFYSSENMRNLISKYFDAYSFEDFKNVCKDIQTVFADEMPFIGLFFQMETFLYKNNVVCENVKRDTNVYKNINTWYINS